MNLVQAIVYSYFRSVKCLNCLANVKHLPYDITGERNLYFATLHNVFVLHSTILPTCRIKLSTCRLWDILNPKLSCGTVTNLYCMQNRNASYLVSFMDSKADFLPLFGSIISPPALAARVVLVGFTTAYGAFLQHFTHIKKMMTTSRKPINMKTKKNNAAIPWFKTRSFSSLLT